MGGDDKVDYLIWNICKHKYIFGSLSDCVDETPDYVNNLFRGVYSNGCS